MAGKGKILNRDSNFCFLALGENPVLCQKCKTIGTDVIHGRRVLCIGTLKPDYTGIFQFHTGIFPTVVDTGSGSNGNLEGMGAVCRIRHNRCLIPAVQDISCNNLQGTGSFFLQDQLLLAGYHQSLRYLLNQLAQILLLSLSGQL